MQDASSLHKLEIEFEEQIFHIRYLDIGQGTPCLFLHGWGTSLNVWQSLLDSLSGLGRFIVIDFPGFGESTRPNSVWNTEDYARFVIALLRKLNIDSANLITHSFGGRVAIRMAAQNPGLVQKMILIASAGLRRPQPIHRRIRVKTIQWLAKTAERVLPNQWGANIKNSLYQKIASRDYLQAGEMRSIFVRVVSEDLSSLLPGIQRPVLLIYGSDDAETPPWAGQKFHALLPNSKYVELSGFDHSSILDRGAHQVSHQIRDWINQP